MSLVSHNAVKTSEDSSLNNEFTSIHVWKEITPASIDRVIDIFRGIWNHKYPSGFGGGSFTYRFTYDGNYDVKKVKWEKTDQTFSLDMSPGHPHIEEKYTLTATIVGSGDIVSFIDFLDKQTKSIYMWS